MRGFVTAVLTLCLAVVVGLGGGDCAGAAKKPEIVWSHDVYGVNDAKGKAEWHLLTGQGRTVIAEAITRKLRESEQAGKLPFTIREVEGGFGNANGEFAGADTPIGIVPIVVTDAAFHEIYPVGNKRLHEYFIVSALDIAFCSAEADGSLRLLGTIPLHSYMHYPESRNLEQMKELSQEEKVAEFQKLTLKMIGEKLDFAKNKKLLKNLEEKSEVAETYQVTGMNLTSKKAQEIFTGGDGSREAYLKKVVGDVYTSAYSTASGNVVYPSLLSGTWHHDAVTGLYSMDMTTGTAGNVKMTMKAPDHGITLDVTGLGKAEVPQKRESNINAYILYKARLAKTPVFGKEAGVMINEHLMQYDKINKNMLGLGEHDVYRMLLIGAASKLGEQKAK